MIYNYRSFARIWLVRRAIRSAGPLLAFVALILAASQASAASVGPGTAQPNILFDGPGPRTNVTYAAGVPLGPGTYDVKDFLVHLDGGNGVVVPFLATYSSSPNNPTFTSIWTGPDLIGDFLGGVHTVNYPLGSQQFTLSSPTDIYAGVWHDGVSKVGLTLNAGLTTAHDPNFGHPGPAGSTIGGGAAFQYPNVGTVSPRIYAYQIDAIPQVTGIPVTDLYSTGVDDSGTPLADDTVPDPHWQLTAGPAGTTLGDMRVRRASGGFPIGPWLGDDAQSAWVGELSDFHDLTSAVGGFTATTTFTLPANAASVRLVGRWSTDNDAVELLLNGQQIAGPNNNQFTAWTAFDITSGDILPGLNTFEARWNNQGGPGGVRVEFDSVTFEQVPEPSSVVLAGIGLLGGVALLRKRSG